MRALTLVIFHLVVASSVVHAAGKNAAAESDKASLYDLPRPVAIQSRKYQMGKSFTLSAGYIPSDSFNRGYTFTGAYRHAFTSYLIWEVLSFTHVLNQETQLKKDLLSLNVEVQNSRLGGILDFPQQIYMTGFHYSPLYSKSLLFNSKLTYNEMSLFLGAGTINFNRVGHKPMVAPGLSFRFYVSPKSAVTAYFRDYVYIDDRTGAAGIMDFGIGFEYKLGELAPERADATPEL